MSTAAPGAQSSPPCLAARVATGDPRPVESVLPCATVCCPVRRVLPRTAVCCRVLRLARGGGAGGGAILAKLIRHSFF